MTKVTEAQKRASSKYDKENTKQKVLKLNKSTDSDILELLDGITNVQGYIKRLIRNDMKNKEVYKMYTNNEYVVYYTITNQYNEVMNRDIHEWAPTKEEAQTANPTMARTSRDPASGQDFEKKSKKETSVKEFKIYE